MIKICGRCIILKGIQTIEPIGYDSIKITYENGTEIDFSTQGYGTKREEVINIIFEEIVKLEEVK